MKMVATAKLRRAQDKIVSARPYANKIDELLKQLSSAADTGSDPLMEQRPVKINLVVVVTGDRGLCGSFNTNVIKFATQKINEFGEDTKIIAVGKKSVDYFKKSGHHVIDNYPNVFSNLRIEIAKNAVAQIKKGFLDGSFDSVYLIYSEFISMIKQIPRIEKFLPIVDEPDAEKKSSKQTGDYIFEPDAASILSDLVPRQMLVKFWKALLESNAAEQAARMTAMDNATRNASDLIKYLDLQYNRARQEAITKEILEIVGGAEALKEG
ncbi:MAG: F0F1-type ATP synthase subunit gamma [Chlorobi bacterium OLB4]|nr:MAG: F0F1-type ATP synthase subunit gamma [Chlorobi bacterium OLB4]MBV6399678.1 ATP synthase gamma chain [Ignavibacteria bacterium]